MINYLEYLPFALGVAMTLPLFVWVTSNIQWRKPKKYETKEVDC